MDLGVVTAVLSTIALLVSLPKAILDLRNAQRASEDWLPAWLRGSGVWIAIAAASIFLFAAVVYLSWANRPTHQLTVALWSVEADAKSTLLAEREFNGEGRSVSSATIGMVGAWVDEQMAGLGVTRDPLAVHVSIPADPSTGIDVRAPEPYELMVYTVVADTKEYLPYAQARALLDQPFWLEIRRPGFDVAGIEVTPGVAQEVDLVLEPRAITLGIEQFEGAAVTSQLEAELNGRGYSVESPDRLARLQAAVDAAKDELAQSPVQMGYRASLGIDYILSGALITSTP